MAVVVNEFEVLPAAPPPPPKDGERAPPPPHEPAPASVRLALRTLDVQALRSWAH